MDAKSRRKIEMGQNALAFCLSRPDPGAGYNAAVGRLQGSITRGKEVAARQEEGKRVSAAVVQRKKQLRQTLRRTHLHHVIRVARVAADELPDQAVTYVLGPGSYTQLGFSTVARGIASDAQAHRDVLIRHGLGEEVLDNLTQALDQFDATLEQGLEARRRHVGASAELRAIADEIVQVVRALDGLIRYRFAGDPEALAAWDSASNIPGPFRPAKPEGSEGTPPAGGTGEVRAA
jgi:hypothetical protein